VACFGLSREYSQSITMLCLWYALRSHQAPAHSARACTRGLFQCYYAEVCFVS
jgi:hypothetical protein